MTSDRFHSTEDRDDDSQDQVFDQVLDEVLDGGNEGDGVLDGGNERDEVIEVANEEVKPKPELVLESEAENVAEVPLASHLAPKLVRICPMEINLTAIWEGLTKPFVWLWQAFVPKPVRARSRRTIVRLGQERRKLKKWQLVRFLALGGAGAVAFGIVFFFALFIFYSKQLPKPGEVVRRTGFSTRIMDRNGLTLYDLYEDAQRTPVTLNQVPEQLKQAVVSIEDKDFYTHHGFDIRTILRIPYNMIFRGRVVGGSTLTQQLVKNALLTNERTIIRKFKELVLSLQIERTFTKDQILEMYLNEAPYGGTAMGIGAAAELYFNKPVEELTLVESVILAGLPQRPSAYSPFTGKTDEDGVPLWKVRAEGVLIRMKEDGHLTDLAYDEALTGLSEVEFSKGETGLKAPHFVFYVKDQLEEMYGPEALEQGGLQVTTSLDYVIQEEAQQIASDQIDAVEKSDITNGSVMVMNPQTGEIIAMVGSRDFNSDKIDGQFNVAVNGLRQPGSSIKPVVYLGMLQRGYTPSTMIMDVFTTFQRNEQEKPYEPHNYDGKFRGPVSLRTALASSLNVPAVKSIATIGINEFLNIAYDLGFETLEPTPENMRRLGLSVALGGGEVHLIDSVTAFSAFANGGFRVEPVSILEVKDKNGRVIFHNQPELGRQVMQPIEAYLINHILSDNNARAMAFGTRSGLNINANIAVKTGTTNDQRDNWAIGWSQEVMVGAWVGNNDNSPMKSVASGVSGATPLWRNVMLVALDNGYGSPAWVRPEGIDEVSVDAVSGYLSHDDFPARSDIAIRGTTPSGEDPYHAKIRLCRGENKLANEARIAAGDYDEKEFFTFWADDPLSEDGVNRWQMGIDAWIASQDDWRYHAPTEYCGDSSEVFVRIEKPKDKEEFKEEDVEVEIKADADGGIDKIELYVDGSKRETINSHQYKGKIHFGGGQHELYVKAYTRSGQDKTSDKIRIGTGGQPWEKPQPTNTLAPTAVPPTTTPVPTVAPTLAPMPTLTPTATLTVAPTP
ncbi:MAG: transglycosylase domain-containing protein [Patescibacteria group bacterium]